MIARTWYGITAATRADEDKEFLLEFEPTATRYEVSATNRFYGAGQEGATMITELTGSLTATRPMSDEQALIRSARRGDLEAFNSLVLLYQQPVYNLAYRIMGDEAPAADATQEAFLAAYRHLGTFHGGSFKSWLLRIVVNACYDELRRRKRRPTVSLDETIATEEGTIEFDLPTSAEGPEQLVQRRELADLLQRGINRLPIEQRMTLVLSDVQGLRYDEIAQLTRSRCGTVKSRLSRARANLREYVQMHREAVWSA